MKRLFCIILLTCLLISLSSCSSNDSSVDDAYLDGIESAYLDVFWNLWNSAKSHNIASVGDAWETDKFTLSVSEVSNTNDKTSISFTLTTKNLTMQECLEDEGMFFLAYARGEEMREVLNTTTFSMHASINASDYEEYASGYVATATVGLYDGEDAIAIIIEVDSNLHTIVFKL